LRKRQSDIKKSPLSPRQKTAEIIKTKSTVLGLNNIPANYFEPNTIGMGMFGTGLIKARPSIEVEYVKETTQKGYSLYQTPKKYDYYFVEYSNSNVQGFAGILRSFVVIKTLSPITQSECANMLGMQAKYITGITDDEYNDSSFTHPTYTDENGDPLKIRYAEIAILRQRTPGRLDNVPIGYPDFDSTPDGVTTSVGPLPSAPYTDFTANGSTASSITISAGGTVYFRDTSVKTPPQYGPTGWNWNFGATASPTGSTAQNIMVTYGTTGTYTVTLTASNATGSTTKTKINLITVI